MESGSLSSLDESDDDCPLHVIKRSTVVVLKVQAAVVILDLPPSMQIPVKTMGGVTRFEEVEVQTEMEQMKSHDAQTETDFLEMKSIGLYVDLPPSSQPPEFDETPMEIVLRHLSLTIHRKQLEQWLLDRPTEEACFSIRPVTKGCQRILRAAFNQKHKTFVLLLRCGKELQLELRTFENLLKSVAVKVDDFKEVEEYHLQSEGDHISVLGGGSVAFFNVTTLVEENRISSCGICSPIFWKDGLGYCTSDGEIHRIREGGDDQVCSVSPLFPSIKATRLIGSSYLVTVPTGLAIASRHSPLDYEFFEFHFEKMRIVWHDTDQTIVFDKTQQICLIFAQAAPRKPTHLIRFASTEYTVDVAFRFSFLYSLTSGGIISRWRLLPNGRHIRETVLTAQLSHCKRLLQTSRQKFAVQTRERLYFVIFNESEVVEDRDN